MRRMISQKQIEGLDKLNQVITVKGVGDDSGLFVGPDEASGITISSYGEYKEINFGVSEDVNQFNIGSDGENYFVCLGDNTPDPGIWFYEGKIGVRSDEITFDSSSQSFHFRLLGLPTSDPQVKGAVWNDNGTLKISSGN